MIVRFPLVITLVGWCLWIPACSRRAPDKREIAPQALREETVAGSPCHRPTSTDLSHVLELLLRDVVDGRGHDPVYLPTMTLPRFYICDSPGVGLELDLNDVITEEFDRKLDQVCETFPLYWPMFPLAGVKREIRTYNPYVEVDAWMRHDSRGWWVEASPKVLNPLTGETGLFLRIVGERRAPLGGGVYWVALAGTENGAPRLVDLGIADSTG